MEYEQRELDMACENKHGMTENVFTKLEEPDDDA